MFTRRAVPTVSSLAAAAGRRTYSRMTIIGRLGREPAAFTTTGGSEGLHLFVASSNRDQQNTTSWYRVTTFASGTRKEYISNLPKGALLHLECDSRLRQVANEQGPPSMYLDLVERHISLLAKPHGNNQSGQGEGEGEGQQ